MSTEIKYNYKQPEIKLEKNPLLVMIHGYGSNENDLFSFAEELPKNLHIISVRGVNPLSFGGYSWYDINFEVSSDKKFVDLEQAIESRDKLKKFIEYGTDKYDANKDSVFLMGFSQGAVLSYAIGLSYPHLVRYVIPMSGYLHKDMVSFKEKEQYSNLEFMITHGSLDDIIPIDWARNSPKVLKENDIKCDYTEYTMAHSISPNAFMDIKNWISKRTTF